MTILQKHANSIRINYFYFRFIQTIEVIHSFKREHVGVLSCEAIELLHKIVIFMSKSHVKTRSFLRKEMYSKSFLLE